MGAAMSMDRPTPAKIVTSGVARMSTLVSLLTALPQLGRDDGDDEDGQRAAGAAQCVGRAADSDQAEQHQRRAVQRVADGTAMAGPRMAVA